VPEDSGFIYTQPASIATYPDCCRKQGPEKTLFYQRGIFFVNNYAKIQNNLYLRKLHNFRDSWISVINVVSFHGSRTIDRDAPRGEGCRVLAPLHIEIYIYI
jgi:hypothetical protein